MDEDRVDRRCANSRSNAQAASHHPVSTALLGLSRRSLGYEIRSIENSVDVSECHRASPSGCRNTSADGSPGTKNPLVAAVTRQVPFCSALCEEHLARPAQVTPYRVLH